ncbi:biofilm-forming protein [Metabacillus niabensis]|nr:biofilm-forming protein [Metabacillus niabensis]PAD68468.1 biofilm-forming protein [Bacillus sp. 7586-K]
MAKKGIQNSSIEQLRNDHETESAFSNEGPNKQNKSSKKNK